jgi:hypothetical protein
MTELGATMAGASAPLFNAGNTAPFLLAALALTLYALLNGKSENDDDDSSPGGGLMQPVA